MAKRLVYICDGEGCGAVLVHPEDGFVITGTIKPIAVDGDPKPLVTGSLIEPTAETALCRECMAKALKMQVP